MNIKTYSKTEIEKIDKLADYRTFNRIQSRAYIYSRSSYDIKFFSDCFFPEIKKIDDRYIQTPDFHVDLWDDVSKEGEDSLIVYPRGHGKTTCLKIWCLHKLLYTPDFGILYIASRNLGEEVVGWIRRQLELNTGLRQVYGNLAPQDTDNRKDKRLKKWRQTQLELLNGASIETVPKGGSVRGKRPRKIVVDDPEENKDVRSKKIVEQLREWVLGSLYNTLLPGGSMTVVGTIIGQRCLVKWLRDEKKWKSLQHKAILPDGSALWANFWTIEALEERKKKIGSAIFNQEFMHVPMSSETRIIQSEWIRTYENPPEVDFVSMAIDPAIKVSEESDFTGIDIMGYAKQKDGSFTRYVLLSRGVKLHPRQLKEFIKRAYERYGVDVVIVESVAYQDYLRKELALDYMNVRGVHPHADKRTRLLEVSGAIEFWEVFFPTSGVDKLIEQLTNFPDVDHDDEQDAFVYNCKLGLEEAMSAVWGGGFVI